MKKLFMMLSCLLVMQAAHADNHDDEPLIEVLLMTAIDSGQTKILREYHCGDGDEPYIFLQVTDHSSEPGFYAALITVNDERQFGIARTQGIDYRIDWGEWTDDDGERRGGRYAIVVEQNGDAFFYDFHGVRYDFQKIQPKRNLTCKRIT